MFFVLNRTINLLRSITYSVGKMNGTKSQPEGQKQEAELGSDEVSDRTLSGGHGQHQALKNQ